ncbi:hypothetical protein BJX61DRAFT_534067 [Aspergillus egyptiacus]|nr:hypothetical protein BJX61DRAFT_534067 [Aspergillus egyptiacus]
MALTTGLHTGLEPALGGLESDLEENPCVHPRNNVKRNAVRESLALEVHLGCQGHPAHPEFLVQRVKKVIEEKKAKKARRASREKEVRKAKKEKRDRKVIEEKKVKKVKKARKAKRELQGNKDRKVKRGMLDQRAILEPKVTAVIKEKLVREVDPVKEDRLESVERLAREERMMQQSKAHQARLNQMRNLCKDPKASPQDVQVGDLVFTVTCGEAMEQNRQSINTRSIEEAMIICAAWPDCQQVSALPDGNVEGSKSKKLNEDLFKIKGGANAKLKAARQKAKASPEVEALYGRDCPKIDGYTVSFGAKTFKVFCTNGTPDFKRLRGTGTGDEPVDCIALCASEPECQAITQVKKGGVKKCVMASEPISGLVSGGPGSGTWVAQRVN